MADVPVQCAQCGQTLTLSEYSLDAGVVCPTCKTPLPAAVSANGAALKLKTPVVSSTSILEREANVLPGTRGKAVEIRRQRRPRPMLGLLLFVVAAGVMLGWQWLASRNGAMIESYGWARYGLLGMVWVLVMLEAFQDSNGQGLACLLIPFYVLFYAASRVNSYWRQALFFAAVVTVMAEPYQLPKASLILQSQTAFAGFVQQVERELSGMGTDPLKDLPR